MPLRIVGRRKEVSPEDRVYIEQKIDRLRRLTDRISVMDVFVEETRRGADVHLVLKAGPLELSAEETGRVPRAAFDRALDKIERQLIKQKDKKWGTKRKLSPRAKREGAGVYGPPEPDEEEAATRQIINIERVEFKPMSVEEAAEQIDVSDTSVLVFVNDVSERINVIYRRGDGHFGLIEPAERPVAVH
jgi:putative sigma-54 modulation protein